MPSINKFFETLQHSYHYHHPSTRQSLRCPHFLDPIDRHHLQHLHGFILSPAMSFLPSSTLLKSLTIGHGSNAAPSGADEDQKSGKLPLRSKSSIANLIQFVRKPVGTVGEAVENWYEGNTKEERIEQQILEDKKQILYLRLRTVGLLRLLPSR